MKYVGYNYWSVMIYLLFVVLATIIGYFGAPKKKIVLNASQHLNFSIYKKYFRKKDC